MALKDKSKTKNKKRDDSPEKDAQKANDQKKSNKGNNKKKEEEVKELKELVASEKDRALRLSAEFENYKKRKQREIDEFKKFANEMVFKQFISVVDNLERAIASGDENPDQESLMKGVKLTHKEILRLFDTFNVKAVEAEKKPFDPNFHQAVTQEKTDDFPENTVTTVLQKGYLLHDRLLRPAMVVVSKKEEKEIEKEIEN